MKKDTFDSHKILWFIFILALCAVLLIFFGHRGFLSMIAFVPVLFLFLPDYLHERKQFKRIDELQQILKVSTEEMRQVVHAAPYDLEKWERGKVFLDAGQMEQLETYLEEKYAKRLNGAKQNFSNKKG